MQVRNPLIRTAVLAFATALPASALAQVDVTGRWTGTFEFVVLGERAAVGPAALFNPGQRVFEGEPARIGEGRIDVRIANRVGQHFFGRWTVDKQSSDMVCTMRDETQFLCAGPKSTAVGTIEDEGSLRMCWVAGGKAATSGCADLVRPG